MIKSTVYGVKLCFFYAKYHSLSDKLQAIRVFDRIDTIGVYLFLIKNRIKIINVIYNEVQFIAIYSELTHLWAKMLV